MNDRFERRGVILKRVRPALLVAVGAMMLFGCTGTPSAGYNAAPASQAIQAGAANVGVTSATFAEVAGTNPVASLATTAVANQAFKIGLSAVSSSSAPASVDADAVITLGDEVAVSGSGATASGGVVTIKAGGSYLISGTLDDGQLVVDAGEDETVNLVLNGAGITSSTTAPIQVESAKTTVIVLAEGSKNYVADGKAYIFEASESNEPDAAIFSKGDLVISGSGSLAVDANYNDAIASKDDLEISGGTIAIDSVSDGIRGRDQLVITGGSITVNAGGDGLKSTNDEDPEKGLVSVQGGSVDVTAGEDGIQSENRIAISGGEVVLASGDDGIHADSTLEISGGEIRISSSYEGIESANITINDGVIHLVATDDGLNVAGGNDGSSINSRPGQNSFNSSVTQSLHISGGYTVIQATGDGIDVNGTIDMAGGTVIVQGPTANNNGALDYDGGFKITGGTLVAVGSSGMAQAPDTSSTQRSVMVNLPSSQKGGTMVRIESQSGEELLTFEPDKSYQSVVLSSPELANGSSYVVYTGGSSTGAVADGMHTGGIYIAGTQAATFTISGTVTTSGSSRTGGPGGMRQ